MLTTESEHIIEVLLIAAGLALAAAFDGELPRPDPSQAPATDRVAVIQDSSSPGLHPARIVEQMLTNAAAHLAELEIGIGHC